MKKRKSGGGASWMDTYGDMVTLLLCFFVLLYSMSSISEEKWIQLVQSFNPNAVQEQTATPAGGKGQNADNINELDAANVLGQDEINEVIDDLYQSLKEYVAEQGAADSISVTKGDGYVFISFNDTVFFSGDSYVLRDEGKTVLDDVSVILEKAGPAIDELRILGHTAQSREKEPNNVSNDRFLASNRATVVLVYLQEKEMLDPARMVSLGYGQWRPVAENDNENRAKNRRVEMIVTGKDLDLGDSIEQYYIERGDRDQAISAQPANEDGTAAAAD